MVSALRFFKPLLSVWKSDETLSLVLDIILLNHQPIRVINDEIDETLLILGRKLSVITHSFDELANTCNSKLWLRVMRVLEPFFLRGRYRV